IEAHCDYEPDPPLYGDFYQPGGNFSPTNGGWIDLSTNQFTNGVAILTTNELPAFARFTTAVQALGADGKVGLVYAQDYGAYDYEDHSLAEGPPVKLVPFLDGTAQMKQNLSFVMKVAVNAGDPYEEGHDLIEPLSLLTHFEGLCCVCIA